VRTPLFCFLVANLSVACWVHAQENVVQPPASSVENDCPHLPGERLWPRPSRSEAITLLTRSSESAKLDHDDASRLEVWRSIGEVQSVRLAVCFGDVQIRHAEHTDQMHLLVEFPQELPRGQTVGQFMQTFLWTGPQGKIFLKAPERYQARITLELPDQFHLETDLGRGEVELASFGGSVQARIAKGRMAVDYDFDHQYRLVRAAIASGAVRISNGENRSKVTKTIVWRHEGSGNSVLDVAVGEGSLELQTTETGRW
jgi:hypothetical protein